jgi:uncharacterized OB-fold protein
MAEFSAFQCDTCKSLSAPPHVSCGRCGAATLRSVTLSGRGLLLSFTTIRIPPARFRGQEPYDIAVIDLEEGLRVTARLKVPIGREAAIGDSVAFEGLVEEGPLYRLV